MVRVTNNTGLTVHTSAHASSPSVALVDRPVELPAAAWEHTLSCGPGLRSLVGEGPGKIEVVDMTAPVASDEVAEVIVAPVEVEAVEPPKAATPAPQGKGKHRR